MRPYGWLFVWACTAVVPEVLLFNTRYPSPLDRELLLEEQKQLQEALAAAEAAAGRPAAASASAGGAAEGGSGEGGAAGPSHSGEGLGEAPGRSADGPAGGAQDDGGGGAEGDGPDSLDAFMADMGSQIGKDKVRGQPEFGRHKNWKIAVLNSMKGL